MAEEPAVEPTVEPNAEHTEESPMEEKPQEEKFDVNYSCLRCSINRYSTTKTPSMIVGSVMNFFLAWKT